MKYAVLAAALLLAACTKDATRAVNNAEWTDPPAAVTCYAYGVMTFNGWSTGKVIYDEGGRLTFVDAANGRLTTVEGECRVVYR